jgi:hypothetical protein
MAEHRQRLNAAGLVDGFEEAWALAKVSVEAGGAGDADGVVGSRIRIAFN